jgi:hypothetical protein
MCFSATASFTLFGALLPIGAAAMARARSQGGRWLPFALYPLAFGVQQGFEGLVWLGMDRGDAGLTAVASRGYLFFSHFFWLAWVPFSVWLVERVPERRRIAGFLTVLGFVYGLTIFLPSFLIGDWLRVEVVERSLDYKTVLIYEGAISRTALKLFYAAIVVSALLVCSDRRIQIFGGLVAASLLLTYAFFAYAFISVWCFFAAILSVYLAVMIWRERSVAAA